MTQVRSGVLVPLGSPKEALSPSRCGAAQTLVRSRRPRAQPLPQQGPLNLSRRSPRQFLQIVNTPGISMRCMPPLNPILDLRGELARGRIRRFQDDECLEHLAPDLIRSRYDGTFGHGRMAQQG